MQILSLRMMLHVILFLICNCTSSLYISSDLEWIIQYVKTIERLKLNLISSLILTLFIFEKDTLSFCLHVHNALTSSICLSTHLVDYSLLAVTCCLWRRISWQSLSSVLFRCLCSCYSDSLWTSLLSCLTLLSSEVSVSSSECVSIWDK